MEFHITIVTSFVGLCPTTNCLVRTICGMVYVLEYIWFFFNQASPIIEDPTIECPQQNPILITSFTGVFAKD